MLSQIIFLVVINFFKKIFHLNLVKNVSIYRTFLYSRGLIRKLPYVITHNIYIVSLLNNLLVTFLLRYYNNSISILINSGNIFFYNKQSELPNSGADVLHYSNNYVWLIYGSHEVFLYHRMQNNSII